MLVCVVGDADGASVEISLFNRFRQQIKMVSKRQLPFHTKVLRAAIVISLLCFDLVAQPQYTFICVFGHTSGQRQLAEQTLVRKQSYSDSPPDQSNAEQGEMVSSSCFVYTNITQFHNDGGLVNKYGNVSTEDQETDYAPLFLVYAVNKTFIRFGAKFSAENRFFLSQSIVIVIDDDTFVLVLNNSNTECKRYTQIAGEHTRSNSERSSGQGQIKNEKDSQKHEEDQQTAEQESVDYQERRNEQKEKSPGCMCRSRLPDRNSSNSFNSMESTCTVQLNTILSVSGMTSLIPPHTLSQSNLAQPKVRNARRKKGRKCPPKSCNVYEMEDHRGPESQRYAQLLHRDKTDMVSLQRRKGVQRGLVALLLMSELQRSAPEESGRRVEVLRNTLVFLACMMVLLRDQKSRKAAGSGLGVVRFALSLLPGPRNVQRSARTEYDSDKKLLFDRYTQFTKLTRKVYTEKRICPDVDLPLCADGASVKNPGEIPGSMNVFHSRLGKKSCCCIRLSTDSLDKKEINVPQSLTTSRDGSTRDDVDVQTICTAEYRRDAICLIYPATSFLPSLGGACGNREFFDHVGFRLASLAALPPSFNISRVRLAEAGFHYDPRVNTDSVLCHRCGSAYRLSSTSASSVAGDGQAAWTTTLSPSEFHRTVSPNCPFLNQEAESYTPLAPPRAGPATSRVTAATVGASAQQPMSEMASPGTPKASSASITGMPAPQITSGHSAGRDLWEDCGTPEPMLAAGGSQSSRQAYTSSGYTLALSGSSNDQRRTTPMATDGATCKGSVEDKPQMDLNSAVYPQFGTAPTRLATFKTWPLSVNFPPEQLVALGFYYAGYADCIRCFSCGVGLKSWEQRDDVLTEHARWRPNCPFLLATKGRQGIQTILDRLSTQDPPTGNTGSYRPISSTPLPQGNPPTTAARAGSSLAEGHNEMQTDGQGHQVNLVISQLLTMGFTDQDIDRARQRLLINGQPLDLDHMVSCLLEEL